MGTPLRSAIFLGLLCLALPAYGQPAPEKAPRPTLGELKTKRDRAFKAWDQTTSELRGLRRVKRALQSDMAVVNVELVKLRTSKLPGPLRTRRRNILRNEQHRLGERLARVDTDLRSRVGDQEIEREAYLKAGTPWVEALLDKAEEVRELFPDRARLARRYTQTALEELDRLEDAHLQKEAEQPRPLELPVSDELTDIEDLRFRLEVYSVRVQTFAAQLAELAPIRRKRARRVKRLGLLLEQGRGDPERLEHTLARETLALGRVNATWRTLQRYQKQYEEEIQNVERLIRAREGR